MRLCEHKAAGDSRTPRGFREGLRATPSARSWSAAVLCRFAFTASLQQLTLRRLFLSVLFWFAVASAPAETAPLIQQRWFEARTAHFNIYSCGPTQEVARVGGRLEQFRDAYSMLAGVEAVASPPILVIAFPTHEALEPFLPLYQGKPANLAAFFHRSSDENLIALSLTGQGGASLNSVYHEYTHLLLRHNALYWPLWLDEGMADVYSTFETAGGHGIRIGKPQELYVRLLARQPLMPLRELFAETNGPPE